MPLRASLNFAVHLGAGAVFGALAASKAASVLANRRDRSASSANLMSEAANDTGKAKSGVD